VLTVRLQGTGNLPLVDAPDRWPGCEVCESYPPEEESRVKVDEGGIHGSRSWRTTIVPREWGELRFEPIALAVFDPRSGSYRLSTLGPLELSVAAPPPTPTPPVPTAEGATAEADADRQALPSTETRLPQWVWLLAALVLGVLGGGVAVWILGHRRSAVIPPRRPEQSPADRARELQVALERWWLDVRAPGVRERAQEEMEALRRDLEAVRFAPGRADHTETVADLEERFRSLLRRA
jgi:hypothetical protein